MNVIKLKKHSLLLKAVIILLVTVITSCKSSDSLKQSYTDSDLYGVWYTEVNEPVDGKCTIEVEWKADKTTDINFIYEKGNTFKTKSKDWEYKHPMYNEVYDDGSKGQAKIKWINKDKFELEIIENQDTQNYKGRIRVYKRKK